MSKQVTFKIFWIIILLYYSYGLHICTCTVCVHLWCPWRSEEDTRFPGTGITDGLLGVMWVLGNKLQVCENSKCSELLTLHCPERHLWLQNVQLNIQFFKWSSASYTKKFFFSHDSYEITRTSCLKTFPLAPFWLAYGFGKMPSSLFSSPKNAGFLHLIKLIIIINWM